MIQDEFYMKRALRLAARGTGKVSPNPMVGAVVVKNGKIVGEGFHPGPGWPHAEVFALGHAGTQARGATLYTTLEPCCHFDKRTPPCTRALLQNGIRRLVSAMVDPNPKVSGRGLASLRAGGVEVTEGCCRAEAMRLNAIYVKWIAVGRPYVFLKAAMTLDGRMATASGESQWITSDATRKEGRKLRAQVDAILVGVGTVLADDPHLTSRSRGAKNPLRVVIDPTLRTPPSAHVLTSEAPTILIAADDVSPDKIGRLQARGVEVQCLPQSDNEIAFGAVLDFLVQRGITSLLVEGGSRVNGWALRSGEVDRVVFHIAPTLFGGDDAQGVFHGKGCRTLAEALSLDDIKIRKIGPDLCVEGSVRK
jgi:diaminohydroxyphosphoribosylaminopyrimidine deaminase/5-amino-6-(5-phosphoribosylamino)uracil reductase